MSSKTDTKQLQPEIIQLEKTRKFLLANLFAKVPVSIHANTYWEEIVCVGFNPQLLRLEAVVSIKRETGYSGGVCTDGSMEYVRFFVDWGNGAGFQDAGLTGFKAYDISEEPLGPQHPLQYMAYQSLDVTKFRKCCETAVLPRVRAVLSWNHMPSLDPNDSPYFGNRIDASIQIQPKNTIECLLKADQIDKKPNPFEHIDLDAPVPMLKLKPVPWTMLAAEYRKADVPGHRLVYEAVYPMLKGGKTLAQTAVQTDIAVFEKLALKIEDILAILQANSADTTFEELVCTGLNTATDTLGAVIHIKRPSGYCGNLCQHGSKEYVAFWADWNNNGTYDSYLGTVSVDVHDISTLPAGGLYYGVMLPANFTAHLKECKTPNVIRIRAVLSWAIPPSTTDPHDLNFWGNRRDAVVQIRPGKAGTDLMDLIYDIGNVPLDHISSDTFLANPSVGVLNTSDCSQPAMDRPFAGWVRIGGRIYNAGAPGTVRYQVQYAPSGSVSWLPVTNSVTFELMHPNPYDPLYPKEVRTENCPDGWIPYLENWAVMPPILERTNLLAWWNTGSLEGKYDLRLAYTKDYPFTPSSVIHYSKVATITLDNTIITVSPTPNDEVDTAFNLDLVIDEGDCHSYVKNEVFKGHLRAIDDFFWKWSLELQPATHTHNTQASPKCRSYGSLSDTGDANAPWSLNTKDMDKCGYTLTLWATDRRIIDSDANIVRWQRKSVGFSVV